MELPDIQQTEPTIKIPIQQVGIDNLTMLFNLKKKGSKEDFYKLQSNVSIKVNLDSNKKGISMSRFIILMSSYFDKRLNHDLIFSMLEEVNKSLESTNSCIRFDFLFPMNVTSPISGYSFPIFYKCKFEGQLENQIFKFFQGVTVQYASYCPCSAELSKDLVAKGSKGFPHAQRSFCEVIIETLPQYYVYLEDLIRGIENSVKILPYPIIKRPDEQFIANQASENPMFVEDAIRSVSQFLNNNNEVHDWIVKCCHQESIHTTDAVAINWKGVQNGFDGSYFFVR